MLDALANDLLVREKSADKALADDSYRRRIAIVVVGKVSTLHQRDAQRLEEVGPDRNGRTYGVPFTRCQNLALNPKTVCVALSVRRQGVGDRGRFNSRYGAGAAEQFVIEGKAGGGVTVLPVAGRNQHGQDLPRRRGESAGHPLQIHEAAEQQSCPHQKHQ